MTIPPVQSDQLTPHRGAIAQIAAAQNLSYQIGALDTFCGHVDFSGRRVLEVGGCLPPQLTSLLGVAEWRSVDDRGDYVAARDGTLLASGGGRIQDAAFDPASVDVIVSIAAFEHISDLATALMVMRDALAEDGRLCVHAGPVWSGWRGHHVMPGYFPDVPGLAQRFVDHVRPWQHLAQTRPEMFADLTDAGFSQAEAARLVASVYDSPRINRHVFEEYATYFKLTGWQMEKLSLWPTPENVDPAHCDAALTRHPWLKSLDVDGFTGILSKLLLI